LGKIGLNQILPISRITNVEGHGVAYYAVFSGYLSGGTEKIQNTSMRLVTHRAEILTHDFANKKRIANHSTERAVSV
jgi:hypothetical protein